MASLILILLGSMCSPALAQRPSLRGNRSAQNQTEAAVSRESRSSRSTDSSKSKSFGVESFSPRGPVAPGAVISLTFDSDIITSEALEEGDTPQSVFSFEPGIDGTVQWESRRQVRFAPARPLKPGTEYVVRVNPLLQTDAGAQLKEPLEYRFQTPALTLKSAEQQNFSRDRNVSIRLSFSDKVNPQDLRKYLSLYSGDQMVHWKLESDVASAMPVVITDPMSTDALRLILEPGLKGVSGPLGLRSRVEQQVRLDFRMLATQVKGTWQNGRPFLSIHFSSYPSVEEVDKFITIEPPVKVTFSNYGDDLRIWGPFEAEKRYTVHIRKGMRGTSDKIMLESTSLSVWMPAMTPFLQLPEEGGYLGTQGRMKLRVRTAAMNQLKITARRVFDSNLSQFLQYDSWHGVENQGKKIAQKNYDLTVEPNKPQVTEIDLRELLGPKATGIYALEVIGETSATETGDISSRYYYRPRYRDQAVINLSNLGIVAKTSPGEVFVFVAGLNNAQAIAGVQVSLYSNRHQLMGEGVTDETGMVTIKSIPESDPDAEPQAIIAQTPDKSEMAMLDLRDTLSGMEQFESSGRDYLHKGYEAFITPERGAYRPGETVHVTGFVRGRDAVPPDAAFPVEVVLERPDGKKMTPEIKTPSATGLLSFDLAIPGYAPTGYYNVEVRMPGAGENDDEE